MSRVVRPQDSHHRLLLNVMVSYLSLVKSAMRHSVISAAHQVCICKMLVSHHGDCSNNTGLPGSSTPGIPMLTPCGLSEGSIHSIRSARGSPWRFFASSKGNDLPLLTRFDDMTSPIAERLSGSSCERLWKARLWRRVSARWFSSVKENFLWYWGPAYVGGHARLHNGAPDRFEHTSTSSLAYPASLG